MHILLVNTQGQADHPILEYLNKELGDDIRKHVSVGGATSDQLNQGKTSIVAMADIETDEQLKQIEAAVAKYGRSSSFKIVRGGIAFDSTPVAGDFEYEAIAGEGGEGVFAEVTSVSEKLARIFTTGPSGIDWPETKYSGSQEEIYRYIVEQLKGIEPYRDHGETIGPADIDRIKNPRRWDDKAWGAVTEHLRTELKFFQFARNWYGDNGHVKTFCLDQAFMNYIFIDTVNDVYLKVPGQKEIVIFLDALMNVVSKTISLAGTEGKVLGIVLSTAWIVAKGAGAANRIATQVVQAKTQLANQFGKAIEGVVGCKIKLYGDWGKLQEFGRMLATHELVWPEDPRKMHVKAAVAYHAYAMQLLLPLSNWPLIISVARKGTANQKRRWEPQKGNYHLYTHAENQGGCKGWWYLEYFIGSVHYLDLEPYADEAPKNLQRKLFGLSQSNIADPELNINPGFYLTNPWKLKQFAF
jgi:hypothetical protein